MLYKKPCPARELQKQNALFFPEALTFKEKDEKQDKCNKNAARVTEKRNIFFEKFSYKENAMETRVAILAIVIEDREKSEELNHILHDYSQYIIGRMGLPYEKKKISLMSVIVDAPQDVISTISGKIGNISGITAKAVYSKVGLNG